MSREWSVSFGNPIPPHVLNHGKASTRDRRFSQNDSKGCWWCFLPGILKSHNQIQNCCLLPTLLLTKPTVKVHIARSLSRKSTFTIIQDNKIVLAETKTLSVGAVPLLQPSRVLQGGRGSNRIQGHARTVTLVKAPALLGFCYIVSKMGLPKPNLLGVGGLEQIGDILSDKKKKGKERVREEEEGVGDAKTDCSIS